MKRFALILAVALTVLPQAASARKTAGPDTLSVISFNIRMGEANDGTNSWQYRYPATILMLRDKQPDIFGLQEAFDYQVLLVKENMRDYKCVGVGREDGKHKGEHMSIFYNKKKVSLQKWGTFWLSETPGKPSMGWDAACIRTATWALMKDKRSGHRFYYVNTHLDHVGKEAQKKGLALIVDKIKEMNPEGYPMVLTGDFNVESNDPVLEDLNRIMRSARSSAERTDRLNSYNGWGKSSSVIDYIYYSGFSSCPKFETIQKKYGEFPFISDHYPIKAVLVF